jgi:hypothetical protein
MEASDDFVTIEDVLEVLENDVDYVLVTAADKLRSNDCLDEREMSHNAQNTMVTNADDPASNITNLDCNIEELEASVEELKASNEGAQAWPFKCQVCKLPANGHIHYGAITCNSCRVFFKRVCLAASDELKCYKLSCQENNCRQCRLNKCLAAGMKPEMVFKRRLKLPLGKSLKETFTLDHEIHLRGLWSTLCAWDSDYIMQNLPAPLAKANLDQLLSNFLFICLGYPSNKVAERNYLDFILPKYIHLPALNSLPSDQGYKMLHQRLPLLEEACMVYCMFESTLIKKYLWEFEHELARGGSGYPIDAKVKAYIKEYLRENTSSSFLLSLESLYADVPSYMVKNHTKLVEDIVNGISGDEIVWTLITMIILLDGQDTARNHYLRLLYGYIKSRQHCQRTTDKVLGKVVALPQAMNELRRARLAWIESEPNIDNISSVSINKN